MFTGIVEELGEVVQVDDLGTAARVVLRAPTVAADLSAGDSLAVNGVCLTVVDRDGDRVCADVMQETLRRSGLGALRAGDRVNLERPVSAGGRLGGHLVQGHVDAVGTVADRRAADHWEQVTVALPPALTRYVVEKGSIAVDGVSLTVTAVGESTFTVGLVPTTLARTTLGRKGVGDPVNLEVDVLAKYVEKLLAARGGVTEDV